MVDQRLLLGTVQYRNKVVQAEYYGYWACLWKNNNLEFDKICQFYKVFLGQDDVFSNALLRQMSKIKQQDCQMIPFYKVKWKR